MKAITLWQPYASLWVAGIKLHETRHWPCSWQGPLAIHAGNRQDYNTLQYFHDTPIAKAAMRELAVKLNITCMTELPWGAVVGVCDRVICHRTDDIGVPQSWVDRPPSITARERALGDYSPGRWYWAPVNMRMLPDPIPCHGAQKLWEVLTDVEAEIWRQLGKVA